MSPGKTLNGALKDPSLEPTLVLTFSRHGFDGTQRRGIPRGGFHLGRNSEIFGSPLDDMQMAVEHASVTVEGGRVRLRDLRTDGGTRVNGQRVDSDRILSSGDVIRLGDTLLVYLLSAPSTSTLEPELIGISSSMIAIRRSIDAVAARKHSVVVTGETGTGKEVVARLLHERSGRDGPFIAVNCGTFTEGLLASDLFGHVRGAFTGAIAEQQGLFRAARGGTLLLDEVAEIPLALQSNLLRVLEMHEVRPVGGTSHVPTDVRVIATSNSDLVDLAQAGLFRRDLYSRLAQWTIRIPPLRERREDIPSLTRHLLARCDGLGRSLTPDLAEALLIHEWPLNVRGLLNVLSVAVVSSNSEEPLGLSEEVLDALTMSQRIMGEPVKNDPVVLSKDELIRLVESFHGKVAALARHLEITRPKLYRMLWAHDIDPSSFRIR